MSPVPGTPPDQPGMLWADEHGYGFDVPATIFGADGIEDHSWHNDACPKFGRVITVPSEVPSLGDDTVAVWLWVEHPDPAQRESGAVHRFEISVVCDSLYHTERLARHGLDTTAHVWVGDDPAEAVAQLHATVDKVKEHLT